MEHSKKYFSRAKESKVHKYKSHDSSTNDNIRDKVLIGISNREDCDEDNAHKYIILLKRRATTQIDNDKEEIEEEFKKLVKIQEEKHVINVF